MEHAPGTSLDLQWVTIHGHERAFVKTGQGPTLLLLHGLGCTHTTWLPVIEQLARHFTVIAPDLLGHGVSAKPRADYSVGGYANGMRDLLTVLDIDKVTVVGHSFGGGIAMQFAYQFPERTERMILIAPGGLGPEVTRFIRAVTLPGFHQVMGVATLPAITEELIKNGLAPDTPAMTVADAAMPSQQSVRATLADIAVRTEQAGVKPPAITVIGAVAAFAVTALQDQD